MKLKEKTKNAPPAAYEAEPRFFDLDVAKLLGYKRPSKIRELIKGRAEWLLTYGDLPRIKVKVKSPEGLPARGQPAFGYNLNEKQVEVIRQLLKKPTFTLPLPREEYIETNSLPKTPKLPRATAVRRRAALQLYLQTIHPLYRVTDPLFVQTILGTHFPLHASKGGYNASNTTLYYQLSADDEHRTDDRLIIYRCIYRLGGHLRKTEIDGLPITAEWIKENFP